MRTGMDNTAWGAEGPRGPARGFTLLEMLMAVLVIGIVMALLIGGALAVTRAAKGAANQAGVTNVKTGLLQFEQEFGFTPPLVKERAVPAVQPVMPPTPQRRIAVYDVTVQADQVALRIPTVPPTATNPMLDNRYSELSLAYYLAGGLDSPRLTNAANSPPIDGVAGPGLYKPNRDGSFNIPADVKRGGQGAVGTASNRRGSAYEPFVNLSKSVKLFGDTADTQLVYLRDGNDANIRYYRWLPGREVPAGSGNFVTLLAADFNVPPMVARDYSLPQFAFFKRKPARDLLTNASVKGATWGIVAAGANGVFGDEVSIEDLATRLGVRGAGGSPQREQEIRAIAEEDNIVEVGP